METKLFDSERRVMECLWQEGELSAKELALRLKEQIGWSKTTTYTVIGKCVEKGAIERVDPGFRCRALLSREDVLRRETDDFLERNYDGSADLLVASLLGRNKLSPKEIQRMKALIKELE